MDLRVWLGFDMTGLLGNALLAKIAECLWSEQVLENNEIQRFSDISIDNFVAHRQMVLKIVIQWNRGFV